MDLSLGEFLGWTKPVLKHDQKVGHGFKMNDDECLFRTGHLSSFMSTSFKEHHLFANPLSIYNLSEVFYLPCMILLSVRGICRWIPTKTTSQLKWAK